MSATSGIVRTQPTCRLPCSTVRSGRASARPTDRTGRYERDAVPDSVPAMRSSAATSDRSIDRPSPAVIAQRDLSSAVLDTVVEAVIVFDPASWLISDVNRSACDVTGRTADQLIGRSIKGVLAGPEAARLGSIVAPVVAGTQDVSRAMVDIERPDGRSTTVEMIIQPIVSASGGSALVAIARDIGERIEVQ